MSDFPFSNVGTMVRDDSLRPFLSSGSSDTFGSGADASARATTGYGVENPSGTSTGKRKAASMSESSTDGSLCKCDKPARMLRVAKAGPNRGRTFYCCYTYPKNCDHFAWANDSPTQSSKEAKEPVCVCNQPARKTTVNKEGLNKGREFYGCYTWPKKCNFFEWVSAADPVALASKDVGLFIFPGSNKGTSGPATNVTMCQCSVPAKMFTTKKEGDNFGRNFFVCNHSPKACDFFEWATPPLTNEKKEEAKRNIVDFGLPDDITKDTMIDFLTVTDDEARIIQCYEQRSFDWLKARKFRLTTSNFGAAAGHNDYMTPKALVAQMLWGTFKGNAATRWGTYYESVALAEYVNKKTREIALNRETVDALREGKLVQALDFSVQERGLVVNPEYCWMGCSPDGIVYTRDWSQGRVCYLIEIKCPKSETFYSKQKKYQKSKHKNIPAGIPHHYYDQIMGCMANLGLPFADFIVWTPAGMEVTRYNFDKEYWTETLLPLLKKWFFDLFLPALALKQAGKLKPGQTEECLDIDLDVDFALVR
jgi:hypothetical protein